MDDTEQTQETINFNERLIAFVKDNKVLYDKSLRAYKNNNLRNKLWAQLAEQLSVDVKSLTTRWRSIRDRYVKELKVEELSHRSGAEAVDEDNQAWELLEQLSFLKDHVTKRKTTSNYANEAGCSQTSEFLTEEHLHDDRDEATPERPSSARKRKTDDLDQKMSTLLDHHMANMGRHSQFAQLVDTKLTSLPLHIANRLEAEILNLIYKEVANLPSSSAN